MIPTRVGQKSEGGYFTGVIRVGNSAYAIIVSPKHTEVKKVRFKTRPTGLTPQCSSHNPFLLSRRRKDLAGGEGASRPTGG